MARNTLLDAKADSVNLPLVARTVQTLDAAVHASNSEGADFLIYTIDEIGQVDQLVSSVTERIKIPIFVMVDSLRTKVSLKLSPALLTSGVSGIVVSVDEFIFLTEHDLIRLFDSESVSNKKMGNSSQNFDCVNTADMENGFPGMKMVTGFTRLEQREQELIDKERLILLEAINVIERATPSVIFYC